MTEFRADLHCHSTCSDGSLTPIQLVELAVSSGLSGLAITDHDTIDAYAEAGPAAQQANLLLLPGVEFSTSHRGASIHILAYAFPLASSTIRDLCERHRSRRMQRGRMILELLKKRGIALEGDAPLDLALKSASVGRPHIAAALVRRGVVGSIEAAFKQYLGEGRSCYVPASSISVEETLTTIHEAGGLAVLAHPHLIQDEWALQELLAMPLDGIEAYYAKFAADRSQRWLEVAARKNWLITGGSDFHGDAKPQIPLGASWVDEAAFQELWQRYSRTS